MSKRYHSIPRWNMKICPLWLCLAFTSCIAPQPSETDSGPAPKGHESGAYSYSGTIAEYYHFGGGPEQVLVVSTSGSDYNMTNWKVVVGADSLEMWRYEQETGCYSHWTTEKISEKYSFPASNRMVIENLAVPNNWKRPPYVDVLVYDPIERKLLYVKQDAVGEHIFISLIINKHIYMHKDSESTFPRCP